MTSESRQQGAADSEASLRETLRATLDGAQARLAGNLAQLRSALHADSSLIAQGDVQLSALIALQGQIDTANPMALAMLNAAITASVANAATLAQQVNEAVTAMTREAAIQQLAAADKAARDSVTGFEKDFYERKIFDPYLRFTSKEDEDAYREREAERKAQLDRERAKGTPEGDLRALNLSIAQMEDAGAHGADKSPDYAPMLSGLKASQRHLETAVSISTQFQTTRAERLEIGQTPSDLEEAKAKIDPAMLAAFSATVTTTQAASEGHGLAMSVCREGRPASSLG